MKLINLCFIIDIHLKEKYPNLIKRLNYRSPLISDIHQDELNPQWECMTVDISILARIGEIISHNSITSELNIWQGSMKFFSKFNSLLKIRQKFT